MRRLAGLLLGGMVALALGSLVASGALKTPDAPAASSQPRAGAVSEKPASTLRPSVAAAACFDYNGVLSGLGWPWLKPYTFGELEEAPPGVSGSACVPGLFYYAGAEEDFRGVYFISGLSLEPDGCPADARDVFRRVIALNPLLAGFDEYQRNPPHQLTAEENAMFGLSKEDRFFFSDAPITSRPASTWVKSPMVDLLKWGATPIESRPAWDGDKNVMAGLLTWYASMPIYMLGETPERVLKELETGGAADCAGSSAPQSTPSPKPTPTPSPETRRYQVTVTGYEEVYSDPPRRSQAATAHFDYRLAGRYVLSREPNGVWIFDSGSITAIDVTQGVAFGSPDCWEVKPPQTKNFNWLRKQTRLVGEVLTDPYGTDVHLVWPDSLTPEVRVPERIKTACGGDYRWGEIFFKSEVFLGWINEPLLPMQDHFSKEYSVTDPQGRRYIAYTITVDRLP